MAKSKETAGFKVILHWTAGVLLGFAVVASLLGVYHTHFIGGGATFGTTTASLSLIALVLSVQCFAKHCCHCCNTK